MFNDTIIVESAVSAFNNAALAAPAFLWWTILALPVFAMVYYCGNTFLSRIDWTRDKLFNRTAIWAVIFTLMWVILFGNNYNVLRDNISVLPYINAAIVFMSTMFIGNHTREIQISPWRTLARKHKLRRIALILLMVITFGMSDTHIWWGPLLQIAVAASGFFIGRFSTHTMRLMPWTMAIIFTTTTAMMMQPEYYRFGQLGNLSIFHLAFIFMIGIVIAAIFALRNVKSRGRIHHSAYVKLKWLARFIVALGTALMLLTESVPVFLGTIAACTLMFAMSVWHAEKASDTLPQYLFAVVLALFGIITTVPTITALGILYWINLPQTNVWTDFRRLL